MTTPYVYKLTHIPSKKWYVGSRWADGCCPGEQYWSSSKVVIAEYETNPSDWSKTIVAIGSAKEMYELETEILQLFDAKNDPQSFNQHNNDGLGKVYKGAWNKGRKLTSQQSGWTEERKEATRKRMTGKPSHALGAKWNDAAKAKRSTEYTGRKLTEEHCVAISESRLGQPGWFTGKKHTDESIQKMLITRKQKRLGV